jgi:uncharacterized protein
MTWLNWVYVVLALVVGLAAGAFIGYYVLRRQMERIQNDPEMLQKMAKQMGYNMNKQQMNRVQQMMKNNPKAPNKRK